MSVPKHDAIESYTGFLLRKVSLASFGEFSKIVGAHGLHPVHFGMLNMIDAEEPVSQQELSERTGIDPSSMVARMDALDDLGLVERARSAGDRRSYEVRLSPAGRRLLKKLRGEARRFGDRFFAPLSAAERKQFHGLLAKLAAESDARGECDR